MLLIRDAAVRFLKNSTERKLDKRDLEIATMIAAGKSCPQVAKQMNIGTEVVERLANKIKDTILREERATKTAERIESLISSLKASKKPLYKIPIHGLLIGRFEDALYRVHISMLGDAAAKGRAGLLAIMNFGVAGVADIEKILARFNAKLPD